MICTCTNHVYIERRIYYYATSAAGKRIRNVTPTDIPPRGGEDALLHKESVNVYA